MQQMANNLADAEHGNLSDIVDTRAYPIDSPDSVEYQSIVERARAELADDGCCVLPGFIRDDMLRQIEDEGDALSPSSFFTQGKVNVYFTEKDDSLPENDPRRTFMERTSGFVTRDMIPPQAIVHRIYVSPLMKRFIRDCLGEEIIYEYADPFAGLVQNVLPPGTQQPWHFDTNEFIVSMMTKMPEDGGKFEYAPMIRTETDENLQGVGGIVRDEDRSRVKVLELTPGDLQIFKGRFSVHRVTKVAGTKERHTAIFAYAKEPGMIGRAERTRQLYGRLHEAHIIAEQHLNRRDALLD